MEKLKNHSITAAAVYNGEHLCRFCGCEDEENVGIFSANKTSSSYGVEDLFYKISTVYPFVMYENDPLPQYICPKCIDNVSLLYRDIQQVLRHQKMLMNLIRAKQPQHEYFCILNEIETTSKVTRSSIKASYNVDINQNTPIKLLTFPKSNNFDSFENLNSNISTIVQKPINDKLVQNIQTKLELNGFTIKRIKVTQSETKSETSLQISDEKVHCPYCKKHFSSQKALALHQVTHLKLSTDKIFEKRLLPKNLRRGRLITINNEKNIRCLNCWQVFKDNKSILQHWSYSDCYYYCFICGHEFPHSPKLLREHMPNVHGISFRSIMKQYMVTRPSPTARVSLLPEPVWKIPSHTMASAKPTKLIINPYKKKKYYKQAKSSTKNDDGTFSCNICHKVFTNYRSSNSHMRIHNMPDAYGGGAKKDVYSSNDELLLPDFPPTALPYRPSLPVHYNTTTSNIPYPVRPPYKIITNNGPLRGIRTKIVQKRNDFMGNNNGHGGFKIRPIEAVCTNTTSSWSKETTTQQHYNWSPHNETDPFAGVRDSNAMSNKSIDIGGSMTDYTSTSAVIKTEPMDNINSAIDYNSSQWTCFICKDNFANSKEYEMHTIFVHNIN